MSAVLVFAMVLAFLLFSLGVVLVLARVLRAEADRVRAARAEARATATAPR